MGLGHINTTADTFDEAQLAKTYFPQFEQALPHDSVNVLGTGGIYASASDTGVPSFPFFKYRFSGTLTALSDNCTTINTFM